MKLTSMSILIKSAKIIDANSKFNGKTLDFFNAANTSKQKEMQGEEQQTGEGDQEESHRTNES